MSGEVFDEVRQVDAVRYSTHTKKGAPIGHPQTMRVTYEIGSLLQPVSEWVCPEHAAGSFARTKFIAWWMDRTTLPPPTSAMEAVALAENGALADCKAVTIRSTSGDDFPRLLNYVLGPKPDPTPFLLDEPQGWQGDSEEEEIRKHYGQMVSAADEVDDDIPF